MKQMIRMMFPAPCTDRGIAHIALAFAEHLRDDDVETELIVPRCVKSARAPYVRSTLPRSVRSLPFSWMRNGSQRIVERALLGALQHQDAVYLWSQVTLGTTRTIVEHGNPIIREKLNGHTAVAKRILDDAYEHYGVDPVHHGLTDELIAKEREELSLATIVSSPSPYVTASLEDEGVEREKIVQTSYGWDPTRFTGADRLIEPDGRLNVLFVGTPCLRKGVHLLLDAWARADIDGRLIVCGRVDPLLRRRCGAYLDQQDVHVLGDVVDMGSVYRSCHFLVFPTLEEGSPLVTYEAMGHGLPVLTSLIGAGEIVRHEREGIICDPYDQDALIAEMRRLAQDHELRASLAGNGHRRAAEYTWKKVAARRRAAFLDHLSSRQSDPARMNDWRASEGVAA
jgi:glycosyltransferase involved in cell wall biosynthesis